jgi:hypothetical protein
VESTWRPTSRGRPRRACSAPEPHLPQAGEAPVPMRSSSPGELSVPWAAMRPGVPQLSQVRPPAPPSTVTRHAPAVARQLLDALLDDQAANVLVVEFHFSSSRGRRMGADWARKACALQEPTTGSPFVGCAADDRRCVRYARGAGVVAGSRVTVMTRLAVNARSALAGVTRDAEARPRSDEHERLHMCGLPSVVASTPNASKQNGEVCV